jgi:acetylcholinesterase
VAVDAYNIAYPDDPIVTGLIMNSGSALLPTFSRDRAKTNFTFVARNLGCMNSTASTELECMRNIRFEKFEDFLNEYQDGGNTPTIAFLPIKDDITFFTDPASRAKKGDTTKKVSC